MRRVGMGAGTASGAKPFRRNSLKRQWSVLPDWSLGQVGGQAVTELHGTERVAGGSQEVKCGGFSAVARCRINQLTQAENRPVPEEEIQWVFRDKRAQVKSFRDSRAIESARPAYAKSCILSTTD